MSNEKQSVKMWSGRFREPLDSEFEKWQRSIVFDWRLLPQEVAASKAHASALIAAGIITADEGAELRAALDSIAADHASEAGQSLVRNHPSAEDIHHFVEVSLVERIGSLGLKLHTGRSRNEQIATDLRLYVRAQISLVIESLAEWANALVQQAKGAGESVMPSYTHMQRAEPVLCAHWLLAYVEMILRDAERLRDCAARLNYCPLGSGAVAGATLALDRTIAARELGFTAPTANSIDATSDRDFILEYLHALTFVGLHLSRFAEEITLFATAEFNFVILPEAFSTGSSAMPQKKNPDLTELIRAKVGRIHGAAQAVTLQLKGLPLAYNKDMQETQEPAFAVEFASLRPCSSIGSVWLKPRKPVSSMPWPQPPISCTKAFPSAPRTRKSATSSASPSKKASNFAISPSMNCAYSAPNSTKIFLQPFLSAQPSTVTT